MVFTFEIDTRRRDGRIWAWRPQLFRGTWMGRRSWRIGWGVFALSMFRERGLRDLLEHVESGQGQWVGPLQIQAAELAERNRTIGAYRHLFRGNRDEQHRRWVIDDSQAALDPHLDNERPHWTWE